MSSLSSDCEAWSLFASIKLEPPTKIRPKKEQLRCCYDENMPNENTGYKWTVSPLTRFWRFIHLGCESGPLKAYSNSSVAENFPANPSELAIHQLIADSHGLALISTIYDVASKDQQRFWSVLSYTLAACACSEKQDVKQQVFQLLSQICTHPLFLLEFVYHYERIKKATSNSIGFSKRIRKSIGDWYSNKRSYDVAFAVTACPSYNRLKHRLLLKRIHIKPDSSLCSQILCTFIAQGYNKTKAQYGDRVSKSDEADVTQLMELLDAITRVKQSTSVDDNLLLISKHKLHWGHLSHSLQRSSEIWKSCISKAPLDVILPKLSFFHCIGLFADSRSCVDTLAHRLKDEKEITTSGIHPFSFLWHRYAYAEGEISKKNRKWDPAKELLSALDNAFYLAFENIIATGKRICVTVDASSSMKGNIVNSSCLDCLTVAASLVLILSRTEKRATLQAFSKTLQPIDIEKGDTIESVKVKISEVPLGGTDCSRPLIDAKKNNSEFDCFVVLTDKETWHGLTKPRHALFQYREKSKIAAKLLVVALMSKDFTIADPSDAGMLDVCGFSEHTPDTINSFISGRF